MESLIQFGYDVFGIDKVSALVMILFVTVFKIVKTRIDRYKNERHSRISIFIEEIQKNSTAYHIVTEQIFQNRFGTIIDHPVIKLLTKTKSPSKNIQDYLFGKSYLKYNQQKQQLEYKNRFGLRQLKIYKVIYMFVYYISAMSGLLMIVQMPAYPLNGHIGFSVYLFAILALLTLAYMSVEEYVKITSSIDLIKRIGSPL